jgi:uncharacterized protein YcfL
MIVAAGCLILAACAQPGDRLDDGPTAETANLDLRFTPTSLKSDIMVEHAASRRLAGLTQVVVRLRNGNSNGRTLKYRALWSDAEGFRVGDVGQWRKVWLKSGEAERIQLTAPSPDGTHADIQVRIAE